jgi:SM-20-related protein
MPKAAPFSLAIDPALDPTALRAAFTRAGRIHIPGFLTAPGAAGVGKALAAPTFPWGKSLLINGQPYDAPLAYWEGLPADQRAVFDAAVEDGARTGFQYRFDAWRLSDRREAGEMTGGALAPVEAVWDFLNDEAFLDFVRILTGDARPAFCDAQATRYRAGDFLTVHSDAAEGKNRLYAYVLNFTPRWRADWGGLLAFIDRDGHVAEAYTPRFNALNLFAVPQDHAVTLVAPFAGADRLAVTGWVRARD